MDVSAAATLSAAMKAVDWGDDRHNNEPRVRRGDRACDMGAAMGNQGAGA